MPTGDSQERPRGDCILRREITPEGDDLYIDQADPRILISDGIVAEWGYWHRPEVSYDGTYVKIRAKNRTVIYRLIEYVPEWRAWIAEWPD